MRDRRQRTGGRLLFCAPLPLMGARRQREHQRTHPAVPAQGNLFWKPHQRIRQSDTEQAKQQAQKKTWVPDPN